MDGKATINEIASMDLYDLMNLNEAIDVWQDMNDLDCTAPIDPNFKGTEFVR